MISTPCPCGSGQPYAGCCGPFHTGAAQPPTALALMRSRYAAFAVGDPAYLFRTWHPRTRPDEVTLDPDLTWTGLEMVDVAAGGPDDETGEVAFVAHWHSGRDGSGELKERSRFARRAARWTYVDGDHA